MCDVRRIRRRWLVKNENTVSSFVDSHFLNEWAVLMISDWWMMSKSVNTGR